MLTVSRHNPASDSAEISLILSLHINSYSHDQHLSII